MKDIDYLKRIAWKGKRDPIYLTNILRHISIRITKILIKNKISPDVITLISIFIAISGISVMLLGKLFAVISSISLILYFLMDIIDGEMARYYFKTNERKNNLGGKYLDFIGPHYILSYLLACLSMYYFNITGSSVIMFVGSISIILSITIPRYANYYSIAELLIYDKERINDKEVVGMLGFSAVREEISKRGVIFKYIKQTLGFPGYFILFLLAAILDIYAAKSLMIGNIIVTESYKFSFLILQILLVTANSITLLISYYKRLKIIEI